MENEIKETVKNNKIVIFTKANCPYCVKAKNLFTELGHPFHEVDLNQKDNTSEYQDALKNITGARSVPRIFVNGESLGGFDDVAKLHKENKLKIE